MIRPFNALTPPQLMMGMLPSGHHKPGGDFLWVAWLYLTMILYIIIWLKEEKKNEDYSELSSLDSRGGIYTNVHVGQAIWSWVSSVCFMWNWAFRGGPHFYTLLHSNWWLDAESDKASSLLVKKLMASPGNGLREEVCKLVLWGYMWKMDYPRENMSNEMTVNLNVLGRLMENRIVGDLFTSFFMCRICLPYLFCPSHI